VAVAGGAVAVAVAVAGPLGATDGEAGLVESQAAANASNIAAVPQARRRRARADDAPTGGDAR
jgi:hypothetical protein